MARRKFIENELKAHQPSAIKKAVSGHQKITKKQRETIERMVLSDIEL